MAHLPALIQDLAIILIAAGLVSVAFRKIGQPVVLGYIIAGLLVGPHISIFPTVTDLPNIQVWAEIGVIFLLFALGLEFSFKKLLKVGGSASITALIETSGMLILGFCGAKVFGWSNTDALFMGAILAISSTTIIIRAFEEVGVKGQAFVEFVFGILIVEDLVAILLLVLLSTMAVSQQFDEQILIFSVLKLFFFITLWFLSGIFILPSFLKYIRKHTNEEMLLVVSLGLCFFMVVLSSSAGLSPALGAFMMGSILAETTEAEKIEHLIKNVKNLFAAIFFVSVGMLIDPKVLVQYAGLIATFTALLIFGKFTMTLTGALISGRNLRQSVQTGVSLTQIGEFSFIIATLGISLKTTSEFLYPIAVSVSAITAFTTPYLIRSSHFIYTILDKRLPSSWRNFLLTYNASTQKVSKRAEWRQVLWVYANVIVINAVLISAIFLFLSYVLPEILITHVTSPEKANIWGLLITIVATAPFFWALLMKKSKSDSVRNLWVNREYRASIIALEILRVITAIVLFGFLANRFVDLQVAAGLTLILTVGFLFIFSRYLNIVYSWLEKHFLHNLSERDHSRDALKPPPLAPWDAHISYLTVPAESTLVGKTLEELKIRENFGITVVLIERGKLFITAPDRQERLFPADRIAVIGTDEEILKMNQFLNANTKALQVFKVENYGLHSVKIEAQMPFCGKSIRNSGIREQTNGLVVGLERNGERILNPDSLLRIEPGDLLWIAGDNQSIRQLIES